MPGLNQKRLNWQNAPTEYELSNYDEQKIKYRKLVENFINPLSLKSIRKKNFYTIATNVLCADVESSKKHDPIEKDLYLPLEIAITKWSITRRKLNNSDESSNSDEAHSSNSMIDFDYRVWMINPGPPVRTCNTIAIEHAKKHKIRFYNAELEDINAYIEGDLTKVMKEINQFLGPDRTVFSKELKYVRQDLGCLKWLNIQTDCKSNPISVYSLEDLYVVATRKLTGNSATSQGIARFRLESDGDAHYRANLQCLFHRRSLECLGSDAETRFCAQALTLCYSEIIAEDLNSYNF